MSKKRYEIIQALGEGRTGAVYQAEDIVLKRKVAMRRFTNAQQNTNPDSYQSEFEAIAHSLGALQHPHLLTLYDAGSDQEGPYIITELLTGQTLQEKMAEPSCLEPYEAYDLSYQMLDALSAAHDAGFYHGALLPNSIILTPRGRGGYRFIMLDLGLSGLAGLLQENGAPFSMADPATMPPELFIGEPVSAQTDLYMLGHLIYMSLLGGHPFAGRSSQEAKELHKAGISHVSSINPELQGPFYDWIATLTHPDPTQRPASAVEAMQSLPASPQRPATPSVTTTHVGTPTTHNPLTTQQSVIPQTTLQTTPQVTSPINATAHTIAGSHQPEIPFWKTPKYILIGSGVIISILLGMLLFSGDQETTPQKNKTTQSTPAAQSESKSSTKQPTPTQPAVFENVNNFYIRKSFYEKGRLSNYGHAYSKPAKTLQFRDDFIALNHGQHIRGSKKRSQELFSSDKLAIAAFFYLDNLDGHSPIISFYDETLTTPQGFYISIEQDTYVLFFSVGGENYRIEHPGAKARTWTQVAFTYSNGNLYFYLNGERVQQTATLLAPPKIPRESGLLIGALQEGSHTETMSGVIDIVQLSSHASDAQVQAWWQAIVEAKKTTLRVPAVPKALPSIPTIDIGDIIIQ